MSWTFIATKAKNTQYCLFAGTIAVDDSTNLFKFITVLQTTACFIKPQPRHKLFYIDTLLLNILNNKNKIRNTNKNNMSKKIDKETRIITRTKTRTRTNKQVQEQMV